MKGIYILNSTKPFFLGIQATDILRRDTKLCAVIAEGIATGAGFMDILGSVKVRVLLAQNVFQINLETLEAGRVKLVNVIVHVRGDFIKIEEIH